MSLLTRPTVSLNTPPKAASGDDSNEPSNTGLGSDSFALTCAPTIHTSAPGQGHTSPLALHIPNTARDSRSPPAPRLSNTATPSGRASNSLVRKTLVILDPIQNTLEMHPVPPWEVRVTLHFPLEDSDRMRKLVLWPLPGSFAFSYPQILRKNPQGGVPL